MATLTQAIKTYSYVDRPAIDLDSTDPSDSDVALLASINQGLSNAASAFNARQYSTAINGYHAVESLIYAHLDPQWMPELGLKCPVLLPRDPSLFDPLLSASSQWLNVLPVPSPASPVRPTTAPSAQLLASVSGLHGAGLTTISSNPASTAAAIADIHLATIYAGQGNTAASTALITRAQGLDSTVATKIAAENGLQAASPAPTVPAPAPAAPAPAPAGTGPKLPGSNGGMIEGARSMENLPIRYQGLPISVLPQRQVGLINETASGYSVSFVQWAANSNPDISLIKSNLYAPHATAASLPDALSNAGSLWEQAALLSHDYFYLIPLALAECYEEMGDYAKAETYFLQAAGYAYINKAVEGPYVWVQLAKLYLAWGNNSYEQGDLTTATSVYAKVIAFGSTTAPSTPLYTLTGLATASGIATTLLPQLPTLATTGVGGVSADDVAIASVLLDIYAKETQINAGLDYSGNYSATVPIWTFTYLQQVAINFAQLALQAEQEVVNYWAQADQAQLTKTELKNQSSQAKAQVAAAQKQLDEAKDQVTAYEATLKLAQTRATDAAQNATDYGATNSSVISLQALSSLCAGGDSQDQLDYESMLSTLMSGQSISGDDTELSSMLTLAANTYSQEYQVDTMNRTTTEMQQAVTEAQAQLKAAQGQVAVAQANLSVAQLEANGADQTLSVFNSDTFTPQVWRSMGNFIKKIYKRYMNMALSAAKLMQQAYNFENDTSLTSIQNSYQGLVDGLFGADSLMADIQSFTDELVTSTRGKKQLVKTSISLANNYGYLFETALRRTGTMTFETTLDDFDSEFPGSYQGRIRSVSLSIQGLVPPTGISGSLTNGGISVYRLPSDLATSTNTSKIRLQNPETLIISDYDPTVDGVLDSSDGNQLGIFEGAGVASSWTLSLPRALNDINYGTLTDVVLTFLYETRYDAQLTAPVLAELASRPGYYNRERAIPLAWLYPDLFFGFRSTGTVTLSLGVGDFPLNQTSPVITAVSLLASMAPGTSAQGISIALTAPGKTAVTGVTDSTGAITSQGAGSAWASAIGGTAIGSWIINLTAAANPALAPGGSLNLSALNNLVLVLDYSFTPRS